MARLKKNRIFCKINYFNPMFYSMQFDVHVVKGTGNAIGAHEWYGTFTDDIRARIWDTSFEPFILAFPTISG